MGFKSIKVEDNNGQLVAKFSSRPWDVFDVETADDGFCITRKRFLRKKETIACFISEVSLKLQDCKLCRIVNPLMHSGNSVEGTLKSLPPNVRVTVKKSERA